MHTATALVASDFEVTDGDRSGGLDLLFADWGPLDRFGIVAAGPFGALGASLLIEAAIVAFYESDVRRRDRRPEYPEIYLFHAGARHGDHGMFDFWPPRKEVDADTGLDELLGAVNDRAITRLAVPETLADWTAAEGISSFADRGAALARIASVFVYDAGGRIDDGELGVSAEAEVAERNARISLDPGGYLTWIEGLSEDEFRERLPGPSTVGDVRRFIEVFRGRADEVPAAVRERIAAERERLVEDGRIRQTFRRLSVDDLLGPA